LIGQVRKNMALPLILGKNIVTSGHADLAPMHLLAAHHAKPEAGFQLHVTCRCDIATVRPVQTLSRSIRRCFICRFTDIQNLPAQSSPNPVKHPAPKTTSAILLPDVNQRCVASINGCPRTKAKGAKLDGG
jgi:hypothetical protein